MEHPDEGLVHAWLDDALSPADAAAMAAHVAECTECAAAVAEARGFIAASSRIVSALDDVPRGVLPSRDSLAVASSRSEARSDARATAGANVGANARASVRRWWARPQLAAAALLMVVAGSVYSLRGRDTSVRDAMFERTDSVVSGPALAPALSPDAATSAASAPAPTTSPVRVPEAPAELRAKAPSSERVVQQSAPTAPARMLSERLDTHEASRKSAATMSAPMSAPAAASPPAATSPALADAANASQLRKSTANDAAARVAPAQRAASDVAAGSAATGAATAAATGGVSGGAGAAAASSPPPAPPAMPRAPAAATANAQSFTRLVPITPGCYALGDPGAPPRVELTDTLVATLNARKWYRARPWPANAQSAGAEWRWTPIETNAAELLSIVRGDTTSYRVSTAGRAAAGCR